MRQRKVYRTAAQCQPMIDQLMQLPEEDADTIIRLIRLEVEGTPAQRRHVRRLLKTAATNPRRDQMTLLQRALDILETYDDR